MKNISLGKIIISILFGLYFLVPAFSSRYWPVLDGFNLIIHEAGHTIFQFFGHTVYVLGGSLMQLIVPLIFVVYFFLKQQRISASIVMMWLGQNLINISVYAGDAMVMKLPLITNDPSTHDWNHLFLVWGLLRHTDRIASVIYVAGVTTIILAIILAIYFSVKKKLLK